MEVEALKDLNRSHSQQMRVMMSIARYDPDFDLAKESHQMAVLVCSDDSNHMK